ncbi:ATP-binding protein [Escherichia coli]
MQWQTEMRASLSRYSCASRLVQMPMPGLRIAKTSANSGGCRWSSNAYNLRKRGWGLRPKRGQARYRRCPYPIARRSAGHRATSRDQCETFLLALKRGSGPAGLSAVGEVSEFAGTRLIRPLLARSGGSGAVGIGAWFTLIEDESDQDD